MFYAFGKTNCIDGRGNIIDTILLLFRWYKIWNLEKNIYYIIQCPKFRWYLIRINLPESVELVEI